MEDSVARQREYYAETANSYDDMHVSETDEHGLALGWLASLIRLHRFESILDVGCGTGRCLRSLKQDGLPIRLMGVEPVPALREIGQRYGLEIIDGDATELSFEDRAFDVVSAFGILHHIKDHGDAVKEMCRVSKRAVFISDSNNFGQGSPSARIVKQAIHTLGLWPAFDLLRTGGKGYHYSEGDGVYYSYSVLSALPILKERFKCVRLMATEPSGANLYRTAGHIALFASDA